MSTLAKPANSGVANISSMIVPCIVKSWLYCSLVGTICMPGLEELGADDERHHAAEQKKMNEVIRYMYPIVLWSVEVIHLTRMLPLRPGRYGSLEDPGGVSVVATSLPLLGSGRGRVAVVLVAELAVVSGSRSWHVLVVLPRRRP